MRSNVLLCRAIARIGEVPQAEGFGKNQRCSLTNFSAFKLAESRFASDGQPLRLASSPLPLFASQTEGDIAGSGLWFRSVALANTQ